MRYWKSSYETFKKKCSKGHWIFMTLRKTRSKQLSSYSCRLRIIVQRRKHRGSINGRCIEGVQCNKSDGISSQYENTLPININVYQQLLFVINRSLYSRSLINKIRKGNNTRWPHSNGNIRTQTTSMKPTLMWWGGLSNQEVSPSVPTRRTRRATQLRMITTNRSLC